MFSKGHLLPITVGKRRGLTLRPSITGKLDTKYETTVFRLRTTDRSARGPLRGGDKAGLCLSGRHTADGGEGGGSRAEFRGLSKLRTQTYVLREAEDWVTKSRKKLIALSLLKIKFILKTLLWIKFYTQMASLMNTINHLRRKLTNSIQTLSENRGGSLSPLILWGQNRCDIKTRHRYSKKLKDCILKNS